MGTLDTHTAVPIVRSVAFNMSCVSVTSPDRCQQLEVSWKPKPVPVSAAHPLSPHNVLAQDFPHSSCASAGAYQAVA